MSTPREYAHSCGGPRRRRGWAVDQGSVAGQLGGWRLGGWPVEIGY
ncbi:hypothetical protein ACFWUZ_31770 [Streptomyces sp. NPDC058646]